MSEIDNTTNTDSTTKAKTIKIYNGDIIKLNANKLKSRLAKDLARGNGKIKAHMFIVVLTKGKHMVVSPISSQTQQTDVSRPYSLILNDWNTEGLSKRSYVDLTTNGSILKSCVYAKIGELSDNDYKRVSEIYKAMTVMKEKPRKIIESHVIY